MSLRNREWYDQGLLPHLGNGVGLDGHVDPSCNLWRLDRGVSGSESEDANRPNGLFTILPL